MEVSGMEQAFELVGLTKIFGDERAVDDLSLTVPKGSFFGMLGPNGAGKTTSLSMAVGLLRPDCGYGADLRSGRLAEPTKAKALVGVLPDGLGMPERLTGREVLTYLGLLRGLPEDEVAARTAELLEVLELDHEDDKQVIGYSTGMRKKLGLAIALLHAPRLLVLDEPFEAVDPVSAATIRTILNRFIAGGGSVVMSSHVMALVEQLCDRVAVVADGKVVAAGTVSEVQAGGSLEDAFVALVGASTRGAEGLSWLSA